MRTKRQMLYDRLYYTLELTLFRFFRNLEGRRHARGLKFEKDFYRKYRQEVLPYWKRYGLRPGIHWYKYLYYITGKVDPRYIPDDIHHRYIVPYFDDVEYIRTLGDKNLHSVLFQNVKRPETIYKHISHEYCDDDFSPISRDEALARCLREGRYILKPTRDTGQGQDIKFFSSADGADNIRAMLDGYESVDYIIQRVIVQHPALAVFNPSSVNTVRVITLVYQGQARILSSVLRIGNAGSLVDNVSRGGYQAVIRPDGTLDRLAYTHKDGKDVLVPQTDSGIIFENYVVPHWDELQKTALSLAVHLPHLRFIGWDFAIDEQGQVILLEFNCDFGQNQSTCGPTFGDMTDQILDDVFLQKK